MAESMAQLRAAQVDVEAANALATADAAAESVPKSAIAEGQLPRAFAAAGMEEYEAFFAAETPEAAAEVAAKAVGRDKPKGSADKVNSGGRISRPDADHCIESEYAMLGATSSTSSRARTGSGGSTRAAAAARGGGVTVFAMDDNSEEIETDEEQGHQHDYRPPELGEVPPEFTSEDRRLREALVTFYLRHNAENIANVDHFVRKYRGSEVTQLWAQLGAKYRLPPAEVVEWLSKTSYYDAPFEIGDEQEASRVAAERASLRRQQEEEAASRGAAPTESEHDRLQAFVAEPVGVTADLVRRSIAFDAQEGSMTALRWITLRGLEGSASSWRPTAWKLLFKYIPASQQSSWNELQEGKRATYATYRSAFVVVTASHKLEVKVQGRPLTEALEAVQQIQKDVERTKQDIDMFRRPASRCSLAVLLFIYSQLNPDVGYIQGMSELAAIVLFVMNLADPEFAEADAFWCFSELMVELKGRLLQALKQTRPAAGCIAETIERLLIIYDPELARHLQAHSSPHLVFAFRWCTLLFAQELPMQSVVLLWDSLLADARRFELIVYVCIATLLAVREDLLQSDDESRLCDILRGSPRRLPVEVLRQRALAICALERRRQLPAFPVRTAAQLVGDLSQMFQKAASNTPVVLTKAQEWLGVQGESAGVGGSAIIREIPVEAVQSRLASFWQTARAAGASASATTKGYVADAAASAVVNGAIGAPAQQGLAAATGAASKLRTAAASAAAHASVAAARLAAALAEEQKREGAEDSLGADAEEAREQRRQETAAQVAALWN